MQRRLIGRMSLTKNSKIHEIALEHLNERYGMNELGLGEGVFGLTAAIFPISYDGPRGKIFGVGIIIVNISNEEVVFSTPKVTLEKNICKHQFS